MTSVASSRFSPPAVRWYCCADTLDSGDPSRLSKRIGRLIEQYFASPGSPRLEEVERLTEDLLLRNTELENKVNNLREIAKQLEAYRDRYVDLYELAPVGYVTLDEEGYVQEVNLAGSQLLGVDRDELIGYPLEDYVGKLDRQEFLNEVRKCCCDHQVLTFEVGLIAKDGKPIAAHLRALVSFHGPAVKPVVSALLPNLIASFLFFLNGNLSARSK